MLDQGVHILDLALALVGDFVAVRGLATTQYWDIAPLEDNAYGLFRTGRGQVLSLHASWTEWKNTFLFEVFGREGYALARGLGGSYGPEEVVLGRRRPEGGRPDEERWQFTGRDQSWEHEWAEFTGAIVSGSTSQSNAEEALKVVEWVSRFYRSSVEGREVGVEEDPTLWDGKG